MFKKILEESIKINKRFNVGLEDVYGQTIIYDILNSEPVCTIYSRYHPYAAEIILVALDKYEQENKVMQKTLDFLEKTER